MVGWISAGAGDGLAIRNADLSVGQVGRGEREGRGHMKCVVPVRAIDGRGGAVGDGNGDDEIPGRRRRSRDRSSSSRCAIAEIDARRQIPGQSPGVGAGSAADREIGIEKLVQ